MSCPRCGSKEGTALREERNQEYCVTCGYIFDKGPGIAHWFPIFLPLGILGWLLIIAGVWNGYNKWLERKYIAPTDWQVRVPRNEHKLNVLIDNACAVRATDIVKAAIEVQRDMVLFPQTTRRRIWKKK